MAGGCDRPLTSLYQPNGQARHRDAALGDGRDDGVGDSVGTMVHLRLTREDWLASGAGGSAAISAFEACRPYFGV